MLSRVLQLLSIALITFTAIRGASAEDNPEAQEMRQQMQAIAGKVMQNMMAQGVNPQEVFGDIRQQMQDGSFDLGALQKKLVERGLIDKETIDQAQAKIQSSSLNGIRRQLDVNDAEWAILQPKIQRLVIANAEVGNMGPMGRNMGSMMGQTQKTDVAKSRQDLQVTANSANVTTAELQAKLEALREATRKAKEELEAARKDIIGIITGRQEAVLTVIGLL